MDEYVRGSEVIMNTISKVEVKLIISDDRLEEIIELISKVARTGEVGDGKIFVSEIVDCIRIRTGDRGEGAI